MKWIINTYHIEHKADKPMVSCKRKKHFVHQHNMLEIIDDTLAIEEVHCRSQPIPVQCLGELQSTRATRHIGNGNDFLEGYYLDCSHNRYDVDVAHEHGPEEYANHEECPYRSSDESLLLLFVLSDRRVLQLLR